MARALRLVRLIPGGRSAARLLLRPRRQPLRGAQAADLTEVVGDVKDVPRPEPGPGRQPVAEGRRSSRAGGLSRSSGESRARRSSVSSEVAHQRARRSGQSASASLPCAASCVGPDPVSACSVLAASRSRCSTIHAIDGRPSLGRHSAIAAGTSVARVRAPCRCRVWASSSSSAFIRRPVAVRSRAGPRAVRCRRRAEGGGCRAFGAVRAVYLRGHRRSGGDHRLSDDRDRRGHRAGDD